MSTDGDFIEGARDVINTVLVAIRRGQIPAFVATNITIHIDEMVGNPLGGHQLQVQRIPRRFALPRNFNMKTGREIMATFGIHPTEGTKIPVEFDNISGTAVQSPDGPPNVTCSDTSVATVQLDADGSSVDVFPVQPPVPGREFTITYTDGTITFDQVLIVQEDLTATQGHFDTSAATNIPLPTTP